VEAMMMPLWFQNLAAYSVQISLLVIAGTAVPWMLRMKTPKAMYAYWRSLLGVCLLLPLIQPWKPVRTKPIEVVQSHTVQVQNFRAINSTDPGVVKATPQERKAVLPGIGNGWRSRLQLFWRILGFVLVGGAMWRLVWLIVGYWCLSRYRRSARLLIPFPEVVIEAQTRIGINPELYVSNEIGSPVTFGFLRPTVLLPETYLEMEESHQRAIAMHEFLHVRRRDWLSTLIEELVRAVLWFEPAIWWLLDRIQLTREHVVDREVVKHTQAPKDYVQALLEVATSEGCWELTPGPLFLTRRHLVQRATLILQDASVSRKRLAVCLATTIVWLTVVGGLVVRGFPIQTIVSTTTSRVQGSEVKRLEEGTGSISGRVTIGAGAASGVWVGLYPSSTTPGRRVGDPLAGTTTDKDGRYMLANLPPGNYRVKPKDSHYILRGGPDFNSRGLYLTLGRGEKAQQVDFGLIKGGVIAGKITKTDGRPLDDGMINLSYLDERGQRILFRSTSPWDDQGDYRFDLLPPGRYLVSVGGYDPNDEQDRLQVSDRRPLTYYPGVAKPAEAKIIELDVDTEVSGIDMVVGPAVPAFSVSGRVVDSRTGAPVANMGIGIQVREKDGFFVTGDISRNNNAAGEYQLQDLIPGRYAVFAFSHGDLNYYSDSIPFEVVNKDLKGVDIKVLPGATISGQVVVEGTADPAVLARLSKTAVWVTVGMPPVEKEIGPLSLNSDEALRIQGLPAGKAQFRLDPVYPAQEEFSFQRVERNGVVQSGGIDLKDREEVTGIRLVLAHGTGTIHGQLKIQGGELPPGARFRVTARQLAPGAIDRVTQVEVDMRSGQFFFDNLPVGHYDISPLPIFHPHPRYPPTKQSVTVSEGSQAEVTLVFDISEGQTRIDSVPFALKESRLEVTQWEGGSVMTDIVGANEIIQPLNWYVINDLSSPIQLENTGIVVSQHGDSFSYACRGIATALAPSRIAEVEVQFMLFDVGGNPIKTLSRMEKINLAPGSSLLLDKWDSWEATVGEHYKASISFVARVQKSDGSEWAADTQAITREAQALKSKLRSGDKS
ncbi:MAG TPA: M56 family metallopeptidase, partial [Terriglobia bacterium]|nr:M56 family metallopeptidase [Terriglobia bacterium]